MKSYKLVIHTDMPQSPVAGILFEQQKQKYSSTIFMLYLRIVFETIDNQTNL